MRKVKDKRHTINIMDIFIILLALVCIFSIVLRARHTKETYVEDEYRLYFQIDDIKSSSYSFFEGHEGEIVRIKDGGQVLGTLGGDFVRGAAVYTYTENGEDGSKVDKSAVYPEAQEGDPYSNERCSVTGYIIVRGNRSANGLFLNGDTYLTANQSLTVLTEHIEVTLRITDILEK